MADSITITLNQAESLLMLNGLNALNLQAGTTIQTSAELIAMFNKIQSAFTATDALVALTQVENETDEEQGYASEDQAA